jgi:thiamine biosynthesis lipoprotein ApbE
MLLPALARFGAGAAFAAPDEQSSRGEYRFQYDHVLGTSLDLVIWSGRAEEAQSAAAAALDEIDRLSAILSTYDSTSEISRFDRLPGECPSRDLAAVLAAYERWGERTGGILSVRPHGALTALNVDALGKAYIIDRAAEAARRVTGGGLLLNIGGDIVVSGQECEIAVADPAAPHDNAEPITRLILTDGAIATSGAYARGEHLVDARTGKPARAARSATVVAPDSITANALATALCAANAGYSGSMDEGLALVRHTAGAEALRISRNGAMLRTEGFAQMERFRTVSQATNPNWPAAYELTIAFTLTSPNPRADRAYLAAWVEDASGKLVRALVLWGSKSQYFPELSSFWTIAGKDADLIYRTTRATRSPGQYKIVWNGLDNNAHPVPAGAYRIIVETNRYHGSYGKGIATIACGSEPASASLSANDNFGPVSIQYGPKPAQA